MKNLFYNFRFLFSKEIILSISNKSLDLIGVSVATIHALLSEHILGVAYSLIGITLVLAFHILLIIFAFGKKVALKKALFKIVESATADLFLEGLLLIFAFHNYEGLIFFAFIVFVIIYQIVISAKEKRSK